jgi:hypothetical protein
MNYIILDKPSVISLIVFIFGMVAIFYMDNKQ